MRLRASCALVTATGGALLAALVAGCDDGPPTRHADFGDNPSTRFSEYRGPYGPYYIRPNQRHFGTPPPDPALAIAAPDPTPDPLLDGGDALSGEGPVSKKTEETTTLNKGFSYERRKVQPVTQPAATPYSMATPAPTPPGRRLRPLLPPSVPSTAASASHPDAAEKRLQIEEQTRRALLLSQPDSPLAPTPAPTSPTPPTSLPENPPTPSATPAMP